MSRAGLTPSRFVLFAAILSQLIGGCRHAATTSAEAGRAVNGSKAAYRALALEAATGGRLLPRALDGRVVVVYFFATWCFPCLVELPFWTELDKELSPRGLTVVMVGMDLEGQRVLEPFSRHYRLQMPVLLADDRLRKGETAFGRIEALPTTFVFGKDGELKTAFQGVAQPQAVRTLVERYL